MEFTYSKLTEEQTQKYLERIGYHKPITITNECLDELIYLHQCHVPFENLTPYLQREPVLLDIDVLYDKVVNRKRGGYCFELNGIFVSLLYSLGFDVYSTMVRIQGRSADPSPIMHRGCIAKFGSRRFFFDVGLGGPMAPFAVELKEEKQTKYGETYWAEPFDDCSWIIYRTRSNAGYNSDGTVAEGQDEKQMVVAFSLAPALNADFVPFNHQTSIENPNSGFAKRLFVNLRLEDGYMSFMGDVFTEYHRDSGKVVRQVSQDEVMDILHDKFGLYI